MDTSRLKFLEKLQLTNDLGSSLLLMKMSKIRADYQ
jgi:hypothetical protein